MDGPASASSLLSRVEPLGRDREENEASFILFQARKTVSSTTSAKLYQVQY